LIVFFFGGSLSQTFAQSITIDAAITGSSWAANSNHIISWTSTSVSNVKIEYSTDNGSTWKIVTSTISSPNSYPWTVPNVISSAKIKISDLASSNPATPSISGTFSITAAVNTTLVRIMPLGNSITWGVTNSNPLTPGYRRSLYLQLTGAGYNFDFVGTRFSETTETDYDRDSEGHPGWYAGPPSYPDNQTQDMSYHLNSFLTTNPPQIILLHIGTNDVGESGSSYIKTASQAGDAVNSLLDIIYNFNHDAVIFLAQIIDDADLRTVLDSAHWSSTIHQKTLDFNDYLSSIVLPSRPTNQKIVLVDMYDSLGQNYWTPSNPYFDSQYDVHPNTAGYQRMANVWFKVLTTVKSNVKIFLEGPYSSDTMGTTLKTAGLIPLNQPYNVAPWSYTGTESVTSIPPGVVDWVLLELRTGAAASTTVSRRAAFLKSDGTIVDLDGVSEVTFSGVPLGVFDYYIVIKHRNHLAIMSANPVTLSPNPTTLYDFTTGSVQYYGGNIGAKDLGSGMWGMISGDGNGNGQVQNNDSENIWKPDNGSSGYKNSDFNLNGQVQNNDNENYWKPNNGKGTYVPN